MVRNNIEKQIIDQLKDVVAISSAEAAIVASQIQFWLDDGEMREASVTTQIHDWIFEGKLLGNFIAIHIKRARYSTHHPEREDEEPTILVPIGETRWVSQWKGDVA